MYLTEDKKAIKKVFLILIISNAITTLVWIYLKNHFGNGIEHHIWTLYLSGAIPFFFFGFMSDFGKTYTYKVDFEFLGDILASLMYSLFVLLGPGLFEFVNALFDIKYIG